MTLIFQVLNPKELIHSVSSMTISNNGDNTFNIFFSVDWYRENQNTTEFDFENVPKKYVFDLVTRPSWVSNGTPIFAHYIDEEKLKEFIK